MAGRYYNIPDDFRRIPRTQAHADRRQWPRIPGVFALPHFTITVGQPTNAVYGFTNTLLKILDEEQPQYAAAAFEKAAPTFRRSAFRASGEQQDRIGMKL